MAELEFDTIKQYIADGSAEIEQRLKNTPLEAERQALLNAFHHNQHVLEKFIAGYQQGVQASECEPPQKAVYLLYFFLPKKNRVALLGDLGEEYKEVNARFGAKPANVWFWKQVLTSLWPLFSVWCKKPLASMSKWLLAQWQSSST